MRRGLHGPNAAFTPADYAVISPGLGQPPRFQSVKLLSIHGTKHSGEEIAHLRSLGIQHFTLRLWDSVWEHDDPAKPGHLPPGKWRPAPEQYADRVMDAIRWGVSQGIYEYQLDCEPNITQAEIGHGPGDYADWLREVALNLLDRRAPNHLPRGVRLGAPPISFADERHPYVWLGALAEVFALFDFLCVNTYWQSDRQGRTHIEQGPLRWRQFGANYEYYQDLAPLRGMPIQVGEWANNIQLQGKHTPAQVEDIRLEHYPIWLDWAERAGYIEDSFVYIGPGCTDEWAGWRMTPVVAEAMRRVLSSQDESQVMSGERIAS